MRWVAAVLAMAPFALLLTLMVRGRVRVRCCSGPAEQDARMRGAGERPDVART